MCFTQQDITDVVTGTIDSTSTAADDATTATVADNVVTTSQAADATTNPGVSLFFLFNTISSAVCSDKTRPLIATYKTLPH